MQRTKRAFRLQVVKVPTTSTDDTPKPALIRDPKLIETAIEMTEKSLKRLALVGVAVYATVVAINTASEIAINAAPKRN